MRRSHKPRSTPPGQHRAVLLDEILALIDPRPGMTVVDCTVGWGGHAVELCKRVYPDGVMIGCDMDAENLPTARERLDSVGHPFHLHHGNFAGVQQVLGEHGIDKVDVVLADLGMSSMQVDEPSRGFSYARDGTLDMRMDRTRGQTAAQLIAAIPEMELSQALRGIGDEPHANAIAAAIVKARENAPIQTTKQLALIIQEATDQINWRLHPERGKWTTHPAARTFQTLRILVNRELANLQQLLRILPECLNPGGVAAIISFHSGEDRLVKAAFRQGSQAGVYESIVDDPMRPTWKERQENPRSRSAKMRWARRA